VKYTLELVTVVAILAFAALFLIQDRAIPPGEEAWSGADQGAVEIIESSGYTPWISPLWKPPSGEIETLLFSLQAALGALVIGYFFGFYRGKAVQPKSP
jgi:ABC-type cobalt transport system, periplasmic component